MESTLVLSENIIKIIVIFHSLSLSASLFAAFCLLAIWLIWRRHFDECGIHLIFPYAFKHNQKPFRSTISQSISYQQTQAKLRKLKTQPQLVLTNRFSFFFLHSAIAEHIPNCWSNYKKERKMGEEKIEITRD